MFGHRQRPHDIQPRRNRRLRQLRAVERDQESSMVVCYSICTWVIVSWNDEHRRGRMASDVGGNSPETPAIQPAVAVRADDDHVALLIARDIQNLVADMAFDDA